MTDTLTAPAKPALKPPAHYQVLLLNDDYTTMEFVIEVLTKFFAKSPEKAHEIMLTIHQQGQGICGVYSLDIAHTKVAQVTDFARQNEHPLRCILRPLT